MRTSVKRAGVVILYNPSTEIVGNINSYIDFLDKLFIVDNSGISHENILPSLKREIIYIYNGNNLGIAVVLNNICKMAIKQCFNFILVMDQDAKFLNPKTIQAYSQCFNQIKDLKSVAVISLMGGPQITEESFDKFYKEKYQYKETFLVPNAGAWINLDLYSRIGGFDEKLFIDGVDYDYCLKAIQIGYRIIKFVNLSLYRRPGRPQKFLNKIIALYSPERLYYLSRSHLYLWLKYYKKFPFIILQSIYFTFIYRLLANFIFTNEKNKTFNCIIKGFSDALQEKFHNNSKFKL